MRLYATLKNTPQLLALYRRGDLDSLTRFTVTLLNAARGRRPGATQQSTSAVSGPAQPDVSQMFASIRAATAPSLDWRASFVSDEDKDVAAVAQHIVPDELVIAYEISGADHARSFLDLVNEHRDIPLDADGNAFLGAQGARISRPLAIESRRGGRSEHVR